MYKITAAIKELNTIEELNMWLDTIPDEITKWEWEDLAESIIQRKTNVLWTSHSGFKIIKNKIK